MKVLTIIGARPQFIKAAAVSRVLRQRHSEFLVHTGQHYDYEMSGVFFHGLELPLPDANLGVGSGEHGAQTAAMLLALEELILQQRPDCVLVYGDTNSTLAGALAASKQCVPIAHVEAGLRSYNRRMPEETNRVLADHMSSLLLCPSQTAVRNLATEGITRGVHVIGDVMLDVLNWTRQRLQVKPSPIHESLGLSERGYLLATVHRAENTDDPGRLSKIVNALNALEETIVFPVHPRTRKRIAAAGLRVRTSIRMIAPIGYQEMVALTAGARMVLTDSGGLQKEAYWLRIPCITLRDETEWVETVSEGWNVLAGADTRTIVAATSSFAPRTTHPALYGDGSAATRCVDLLG